MLWSNNCIEHENNGDRNKTLSIEGYLCRNQIGLGKKIINAFSRL